MLICLDRANLGALHHQVFKGTALKDKHPYNAQNDVWEIANNLNQSMARALPDIYNTYFEQQREVNAELMRKINPLHTLKIEPFYGFDHVKAAAGLNMEVWGNLDKLVTGDASISKMVQGFLDIGASSVLNIQTFKILEDLNRSYRKDVFSSVQNLTPKFMATSATNAMAEAAVSHVMKNSSVSAVARAHRLLPDYDVSPWMSQISTAMKADAIAIDISETLTSQLEIPAAIIKKLGRTLDFYQVNDLPMAVKVAITDPEIKAIVIEIIDEHPEQVQEFASKVTRDVHQEWFPSAPSEYVRAVSPGIAGIFNITQAVFTGIFGDLLVYVVLGTVLLVAFDAAGTILKDIEDSRAQDASSE